ncbi:MAG: MerR family transcriptional regulator [Clostridiales bacterium]|nr:MerR family transcriptional regulator [Clostridiales bacterium]
MTIKEIEGLSKMERANIRFYEREGFITPERLENGYRNYSEDDLQILLRIKLLRSLHVSLDEIRSLISGEKNLVDMLSKQIVRLEQEKKDVSYAQDVCRAIQNDRVAFANLDARKYLDDINRAAKESNSSYFSVKGDELSQAHYPWRRFLARILDITIYNILWSSILVFVFHTNLIARGNFGSMFDTFMGLAIMLFLEPVWLNLFGTTAGKAIFGLRIENSGGGRISYSEGLERTWSVIGLGYGYNIPIYSLYRLWKSYKMCNDGEALPWDTSISYKIKNTKAYRSVVFVSAYIAILALSIFIISAQPLPPNRGDLTVAEFVENHNFYADFHDFDFGNEYLNSEGKWVEKEFVGTVYIDIGYSEKPEYNFVIDNGYIKSVSFEVEIKNNEGWLKSYNTHLFLSSIAFAGAQNEVGMFSKIPKRIAEQIENNSFSDFNFREADITFTCDVKYSGYVDTLDSNFEVLFPKDDAKETYFSLDFSMSK